MKTTRTRRARSLLAVPALAAAATLVLAGCGARAGDDAEPAESAPRRPRAASTPPATRSSSASSTPSPVAWRSRRRPSPTCCTWPRTRSTPTAASSASRSSTSRKTAPPTGRPSRRRPRSCSPRTASPRSSAAGPRRPARPSSRSSRRTTACSSTRCSTRASRRRRTSTTPVRPPTSRSSRRWTTSPRKGVKTLFLAGSDYVFPRTANAIIKLYAAELGIEIVGEEYVPLDKDDWTTQVSKIVAAEPGLHLQHDQRLVERRLHQGLLRRRPHPGDDADHLGVDRRGGGAGHGSRGHRQLRVVELLPVAGDPQQPGVHRALAGLPRQQRRHLRPDGGRVHLAVPVQGSGRGGRFVRRRRGERRRCGRRHHRRRAGGRRHAGRREPPHLQAGQHRQDQRRQPVRHRLVVRRLHRSRPVPRGLRLVPRRRPRRAREPPRADRHPTGRGVPCRPRHGTPRSRTDLQNSSPRTESESTWTHSYRRC